ncbi:MAG: c-type cytochrome [Tranquillimonas sp.]
MNRILTICAAAALGATPVLAQEAAAPTGDAAAGEKLFRQCQSCHVVRDDEGNTLAGRNGKTGPNLYGLPGRPAGSVEDYRYSKAMEAAGEEGLTWDEAHFVGFVQDPSGYLKEYLDDSGARSKMSFRMRSEEGAANMWAYLVSLSPEAEGSETGSGN